jgi:GTPase SAR1 family protein
MSIAKQEELKRAAKVTAPVVENIVHTERRVASNTFDTNVPEKNKNYVKFGHYADLKRIIDSNMFYPVFITGQSGNGKTAMVEQICAELKREMYRVNFTPLTDESDLLGDKTLVDGNVIFEEGVVITAAKRGAILLLDEVDYATAQGFTALQSILEGKPFLNKKTGEMVYPVPGFNVIATANTKGKGSEDGRFVGTQFLNEAFLERFSITMEQEYPTKKTEANILTQEFFDTLGDKQEEFVGYLTDWAETIRKTFDDGGANETMSTRRLLHIARAYVMFKDRLKAIKLCVARFDTDTRDSWLDLYTKIDPTTSKKKPDASATEPKVETAEDAIAF